MASFSNCYDKARKPAESYTKMESFYDLTTKRGAAQPETYTYIYILYIYNYQLAKAKVIKVFTYTFLCLLS